LSNYGDFKENSVLKRCELPVCPVETALLLCGDRWKVLIVLDLLTGTSVLVNWKNFWWIFH